MTDLLESLSDNIVVDTDKCTACGICVEACVLDNLRLLMPPCRAACPLRVNCQGYMKMIARGEDEKALEEIRKALPFPAILGRICSQPCEAECHRARSGEADPLAIRALKRYLTENIVNADIPLPEMAPDSGKTVGIMGSGPAGMLAAYDLRIKGHGVVVFEAEPEPGGMLRWAIPEFRLPLPILQVELWLLERMGVQFRCGVRIPADLSLKQIRKDFDAVIVATGCSNWIKPGIEGQDLSGVLYGLQFLRDTRACKPPDVGSTVVVIGGGNVAVDAAQTALRLGAEDVTIVCLESRDELPAFPWAVETALFEKIKFEYGWGPVRFLSSEGSVSGVELQRCVRVFDETGAFAPLFLSQDRRIMMADSVIVAIGQTRDTSPFENTGLLHKGAVEADALTLQTKDERIFLAGDLVSGPSSVIEAMARGRDAAESVHRFVTGEHLRYARAYAGPVVTEFDIAIRPDLPKQRAALSLHRCKGRGDFREIEQAFDPETARREAERCNSCGRPVGFYRTCWFCLPCEVECPEDALRVEVPYLLR